MSISASLDDGRSVSRDSLLDGEVLCFQHRQGYRFSIDAVLAAHFCYPCPGDRILDLGTGNGVIGLLLAYRYPDVLLTGIEVQAGLAALARDNISRNKQEARFTLIEGDLCCIDRLVTAESFDLVVANPPFYPLTAGRLSHDRESAVARHEIKATLDDFCRAAGFALKNHAVLVLVYESSQCSRLFAALEREHLAVKQVRPVYSYPEAEQARLVLVRAVKNGGPGCCLQAPLWVYRHRNGPYGREVAAMLRAGPMAENDLPVREV